MMSAPQQQIYCDTVVKIITDTHVDQISTDNDSMTLYLKLNVRKKRSLFLTAKKIYVHLKL